MEHHAQSEPTGHVAARVPKRAGHIVSQLSGRHRILMQFFPTSIDAITAITNRQKSSQLAEIINDNMSRKPRHSVAALISAFYFYLPTRPGLTDHSVTRCPSLWARDIISQCYTISCPQDDKSTNARYSCGVGPTSAIIQILVTRFRLWFLKISF